MDTWKTALIRSLEDNVKLTKDNIALRRVIITYTKDPGMAWMHETHISTAKIKLETYEEKLKLLKDVPGHVPVQNKTEGKV